MTFMSKYTLFTLIGLTVPLLIGFLLTKFVYRKKSASKAKKTFIFTLLSLLLVSAVSLIYLLPRYEAKEEAISGLKSEGTLKYEETDNYYAFKNEKSDSALIFYSGAKIDERAYGILAKKIGESGIDVYVIKAMFHLPLFNISAPDQIIADNSYEHIYISGHSLGGAVASIYASKNKVDGVIMLASYPSKNLNDDVSLLSIYGDKDSLLQRDTYEKEKGDWPKDSHEFVIQGGNHSYYGCYGIQIGDDQADISVNKQIEITAEKIIEFIQNS